MQLKISKTLEGIIARSAFNTTKAGMTHSLKDFLTLELLREEGSLAYQLLSSRLKDWELYQVRLRIEREIISVKTQTSLSPEAFLPGFHRGAARHVGSDPERLDRPCAAGYRQRPHDRYRARIGDVSRNPETDCRRPAEVLRGR